MLPYRDGRITRIALGLFFVLIIGYAYFEARGVIYGPVIEVSDESHQVSEPFVSIQGKADRIASLSMDGRAISVTEDGAFNEAILLSPGLNRILLDATDRYGRHAQRVVSIVYKPDPNAATSTRKAASSTLQAASTTPQNP